MKFTIQALPVRCGDCLYITCSDERTGKDFRILIDMGYANTSHRTIKPIIQDLINQQKKIQLLILTHTDNDHIGGVKPLLESFGTSWFEKAWFNYAPNPLLETDTSGEVSIKSGIQIRDAFLKAQLVQLNPILSGHTESVGNASLTVMSPDQEQFTLLLGAWKREETSVDAERPVGLDSTDFTKSILTLTNTAFQADQSYYNRSSIAFLFELPTLRVLFTADAHPDVLVRSLQTTGYTPENPLTLQLMQVAHHGSKGNTSPQLMSYINCRHFLISTNVGNRHGFPHKEALARIIWSCHQRDPDQPIHFYFTYPEIANIPLFTSEECQLYKLILHIPDSEQKGAFIAFHL